MTRPGDGPFTERTPRVAAARALTRRAGREKAGRFLVEGAQAVREALHWAMAGRGQVHELFVAGELPADLATLAAAAAVRVSAVTDRAAATLSETVTPQGIVAVCDLLDVPLAAALAGTPPSADTGGASGGSSHVPGADEPACVQPQDVPAAGALTATAESGAGAVAGTAESGAGAVAGTAESGAGARPESAPGGGRARAGTGE
jgi:hypothetical protein